ncbi:MAG: Gfo/Idh/MocA family oxidoreductase [Armatimonadota bacterium]
MQTVRFGIIGTANIANSTHIPCLQKQEGVEIVALSDLDPVALTKTQQRTGAPVAVRDYQQLLTLPEVDAVVVATPNDTHAEIVVAALEAGKHVLCEKPMATSARDCDRMIAAAERAGKTLQIAQPYRYSPFYRHMQSLCSGGVLGKVELMWAKEFMLWGDVAPSDRAWRMYQGRSGGALVEKNCHHLDLMTWMIGAHPTRVCAFGGKNVFQKPEIIDNATVIVEYDNGARAMLLLSLFQSKHMIDLEVGAAGVDGRLESFDQSELYLYQRPEHALTCSLQAMGWSSAEIAEHREELTRDDPSFATLSPDRVLQAREANAIFRQHQAVKRPDNIATLRDPRDEGMHSGATAMHDDFLHSVRTGARPFCDARVGKDSILIGLAGELSIREGRVVEVAEVL